MMRSLYDRLNGLYTRVSLGHGTEMGEHWSIPSTARVEIKKNIIEFHAKESGLLQEAMNGNLSFERYGEPVLNLCEAMEERLKKTKTLTTFKTKDLLLSEECKDITKTLSEENIVYPNHFFTSRYVLPTTTIAKNKKFSDIRYSWQTGNINHVAAKTWLPYLGVSTGVGLYAYFNHLSKGDIMFYPTMSLITLGGIDVATLAVIGIIDFGNCEHISKQRNNFCNALKSLDNSIMKLYHEKDSKQ